jgi:hypothetical protein
MNRIIPAESSAEDWSILNLADALRMIANAGEPTDCADTAAQLVTATLHEAERRLIGQGAMCIWLQHQVEQYREAYPDHVIRAMTPDWHSPRHLRAYIARNQAFMAQPSP